MVKEDAMGTSIDSCRGGCGGHVGDTNDDGLCVSCAAKRPARCATCLRRNGLCAAHQPSLETALRASVMRGIHVVDAASALAAEPRGSL